jgi:hypothetical protein
MPNADVEAIAASPPVQPPAPAWLGAALGCLRRLSGLLSLLLLTSVGLAAVLLPEPWWKRGLTFLVLGVLPAISTTLLGHCVGWLLIGAARIQAPLVRFLRHGCNGTRTAATVSVRTTGHVAAATRRWIVLAASAMSAAWRQAIAWIVPRGRIVARETSVAWRATVRHGLQAARCAKAWTTAMLHGSTATAIRAARCTMSAASRGFLAARRIATLLLRGASRGLLTATRIAALLLRGAFAGATYPIRLTARLLIRMNPALG